MKALVIDNIIFYKNLKTGEYYSPGIYSDQFFKRYLKVFDKIKIVAKIKETTNYNKMEKIDTSKVEIVELPGYKGLKEMFCNLPTIIKKFYKIEEDCNCSILRVVQLESIFAVVFGRLRKPYVVEVVNDPKSIKPKYSIERIVSMYAMRYFLKNAVGTSYITEYILQEKYPCRGMKDEKYFYSNYPTLDLFDEEIEGPRKYPQKINKLKIIHVANVIQGVTKGHMTLIEAAEKVIKKGYDIDVTFIGDGESKIVFEKIVKEKKLGSKIHFIGRLPCHKDVLLKMKEADLFVFPSYNEGQGRVNIEAQAVGLPCLASNVGGIVELFKKEYLFDPKDSDGFSEAIIFLYNHPEELEKMSKENINNVKKFSYSYVSEKRTEFYERLREIAR